MISGVGEHWVYLSQSREPIGQTLQLSRSAMMASGKSGFLDKGQGGSCNKLVFTITLSKKTSAAW